MQRARRLYSGKQFSTAEVQYRRRQSHKRGKRAMGTLSRTTPIDATPTMWNRIRRVFAR